MSRAKGFSVRIFVPSGEPEGLRIVEKSNWTGQGLVFPRPLLAEVRKRSDQLRTGVYILWGPSDSGQLPRVYVGEGDSLLPRLDSHAKSKDFWTQAVVFTSKDQNLNKAHVQYLEARLVRLAADVKRCELDNANVPQIPSAWVSGTPPPSTATALCCAQSPASSWKRCERTSPSTGRCERTSGRSCA